MSAVATERRLRELLMENVLTHNQWMPSSVGIIRLIELLIFKTAFPAFAEFAIFSIWILECAGISYARGIILNRMLQQHSGLSFERFSSIRESVSDYLWIISISALFSCRMYLLEIRHMNIFAAIFMLVSIPVIFAVVAASGVLIYDLVRRVVLCYMRPMEEPSLGVAEIYGLLLEKDSYPFWQQSISLPYDPLALRAISLSRSLAGYSNSARTGVLQIFAATLVLDLSDSVRSLRHCNADIDVLKEAILGEGHTAWEMLVYNGALPEFSPEAESILKKISNVAVRAKRTARINELVRELSEETEVMELLSKQNVDIDKFRALLS